MLELRNITKRFGNVLANDRVNIVVQTGTIHAVVGENGAGKSTAMRIAYGFYRAGGGEILVDGKRQSIHNPHDAIALGIGMVHQHFMLVETMTVAENIVLGAEPGNFAALDLRGAENQIRALSEEFRLAIDPTATIENLSVGQQQRVELLKALFREARILILDEPTAVLTPQEVEEFFQILRRMREQGKTVIIITHKLEEVLAISDEVSVMRDGRVVGRRKTSETNAAELARLMVGRDVLLRVEKKAAQAGATVLRVRNLSMSGANASPIGRSHQEMSGANASPIGRSHQEMSGANASPIGRSHQEMSGANASPIGRSHQEMKSRLHDVSFEVRSGEIVGIAGVEGNGQTELIEALAGLIDRSQLTGDIEFEGQSIASLNARKRKERGIAHVPEDRHRRGLLLDSSLAENSILGVHYRKPAVRRAGGVMLDEAGIRARAKQVIEDFDVRPPDAELPARALSGGNQQKLIIGREFLLAPKLLLVSQPTRGVDIGAIEFIHRKLVGLRDAGCAVLLVSAELEEVTALADRLLVIYKGRIAGEVDPAHATKQQIGLMMTGGVA